MFSSGARMRGEIMGVVGDCGGNCERIDGDYYYVIDVPLTFKGADLKKIRVTDNPRKRIEELKKARLADCRRGTRKINSL
jgi:hypothetical protein